MVYTKGRDAACNSNESVITCAHIVLDKLKLHQDEGNDCAVSISRDRPNLLQI